MDSSKFFSNASCKWFPCHDDIDEEKFNCMFCYCPLYTLGTECGGDFSIMEDGTKDCSSCAIPHREGGYEYIRGKWPEIAELTDRNTEKTKDGK